MANTGVLGIKFTAAYIENISIENVDISGLDFALQINTLTNITALRILHSNFSENSNGIDLGNGLKHLVIRGGPFFRTGFSILSAKGLLGPHPPTPKSFQRPDKNLST